MKPSSLLRSFLGNPFAFNDFGQRAAMANEGLSPLAMALVFLWAPSAYMIMSFLSLLQFRFFYIAFTNVCMARLRVPMWRQSVQPGALFVFKIVCHARQQVGHKECPTRMSAVPTPTAPTELWVNSTGWWAVAPPFAVLAIAETSPLHDPAPGHLILTAPG